ncbi:MAG: malto-oligosyltrehalose synthase [Microvirga sp.]
MGNHRRPAQAGRQDSEATVIAAPARCFEPENLSAGARLWGAAAQVYSLRSRRNLGIGDFSDVTVAAEGLGRLGGSFLGLSPVHALFGSDRGKISPYSPSSRLFLEPIFVDPTAIEGFDAGARRLLDGSAMQERLAALKGELLIDHRGVWDIKRPLFDALWAEARAGGGLDAFERFRREGGAALEAHATFEALSEDFTARGHAWSGDWPEAFRNVHSQEVRDFRESHEERVAFHAWLQFLADRQLGHANERARASGMSIGLYRDLAVGSDSGGSEIWSHPERFAFGLAVGAPPDPLGPQGQNWGLPPFNPLTLEEGGLAAFRALVSSNMRHAGAIRIDHAFQLQRLFLIPAGLPSSQGAYLAYPFEAMLAVLRLESHRARCLVIAEDLGTGPDGFSDAIMASGILSYRVLPFERESDGGFKKPDAYPRSALAVTTTHDLPTFRGWWRGLDVDLRETLGVYDPVMADRERAGRASEIALFCRALAEDGLLPDPTPPVEPPLHGALRYLARTPSALVSVQMEDAAGEMNQANMPGLDRGHPNWRRRQSMGVADLVAPGGPFARIASAMTLEGRDAEAAASPLSDRPPRATYRLQFHKDFTFDDAARIAPYLAKLGISHVYSSPIQTARAGSMHGYDVVDHGSINPELGGEEGFERLTDALRAAGLGLILDIVPNHMGVGGADNGWWLSNLEWGELSPVAAAFDIDRERLGAGGKLILPFLGETYGVALEKGDLKLAFDAAAGAFSVWHWDHRFPVCPLTYPPILDLVLGRLPSRAGREREEIAGLAERLRSSEGAASSAERARLPAEAEAMKQVLSDTVRRSPALGKAIDEALAFINGTPGLRESFATLHRLLEAQSYRLAYWRVASSDINFRRFFDVNTLGGLRVEDEQTFAASHALIFRLVRENRIQGLRIDHIDGLADPAGYANALQGAIGPGFYVVVEKILERDESLRPWPIAGTSGYDALNWLDGVSVDTRAVARFDAIYRAATGIEGSYEDLLHAAKSEILEKSFVSELAVLVSDLKRLADRDLTTRDITTDALHRALADIITRFPVYRTYIEGEPAPADRRLVEETVAAAAAATDLPDGSTHAFIAARMLDGRVDDLSRRFRRRFQQLTGPIMAKSLEDTLFYRFVRLLSLNEVGGAPERFGVTPEDFHRANRERAGSWPNAMVATATHDTKRGEDARARLNILSELPDVWEEALERWTALVAPLLSDKEAPDRNDGYMLLQALLGAWPIELLGERSNRDALNSFRDRMEAYLIKALREGKRHTSWLRSDAAYEDACLALLRQLLGPRSRFIAEFRPLARRLAGAGMVASLSRTILKCTVPGIPDIYQGTEFWDLSLVDPDNRRPVDYDARITALDRPAPLDAMLARWQDGRIKQAVLARLLADRASAPALYAGGDYATLEASGGGAGHVIAFSRTAFGERLIVVVPRLVAGMSGENLVPVGADWTDTRVPVAGGSWREILTGRDVDAGRDGLALSDLFTTLPFAVLRA